MKKTNCRLISILMISALLAILPATTVIAAKATITAKSTISKESGGGSSGGDSRLNHLNNEMLVKMNGLRSDVGVGNLSMDSSLIGIAAVRAVEASTKWSHTRPDGSQGCDMIPGNKWRGENLSYVTYSDFDYSDGEQDEAAEVMFKNLVASPTHYDNMVFKSFTKVGIDTNVLTSSDGIRLTTAYLFSN